MVAVEDVMSESLEGKRMRWATTHTHQEEEEEEEEEEEQHVPLPEEIKRTEESENERQSWFLSTKENTQTLSLSLSFPNTKQATSRIPNRDFFTVGIFGVIFSKQYEPKNEKIGHFV